MRSGFHCPRGSEMADRARITDLELEGALRALGPRYPYPSTPNLAVRVRTRLAAPPVMPLPRVPLVRQTGLGVLITECRGDLIPGFISKEVGPGATAEEVSVNGDPGWWIAGEPHTILIRVSPDSSQLETLRLAANTLVWAHGGVTYRIESDLSKADAMRIASSLP